MIIGFFNFSSLHDYYSSKYNVIKILTNKLYILRLAIFVTELKMKLIAVCLLVIAFNCIHYASSAGANGSASGSGDNTFLF